MAASFINFHQLLTILCLLAKFVNTTINEDINKTQESTTVETPLGSIEGFQQTFSGKTVTTYLGIPYAEPPVGELRFKKPIPAKPRGSIKATKFSHRCSSNDPFDKSPSSEDCLYLNIWRPACSDNSLKPVMVWIHGGGFVYGSASLPFYNGLVLSAYGDVLVVSMNYRLGAFGFLNLGGVDDVSGNVGMHDQVLALQWIKNNIRLFGGDPSLITIFGESAGAFSVGYHLISPLSKHLFSRAILQSGALDGDIGGFNVTRSVQKSWKLAKSLGCIPEDATPGSDKPSEGILKCLQAIEENKILAQQGKMLQEDILGSFSVTVDGSFLPELPDRLAEEGAISSEVKEVMVGVTSDEGSMLVAMIMPKYFGREEPNFKNDLAKEIMKKLHGDIIDEEAFNEAVKIYLGKYNESLSYKAVYESYGDYLITCPAVFTTERLADHGKQVYFYEFAQVYLPEEWKAFGMGGDWMGVPHAAEIPFLFGLPVLIKEHDESVVELSKRVMHAWTTFARTGKPADQLGQEWPLFTRENPRYFKLRADKVFEEVGHHQEGCEMWRSFYERRWDALEPKQPL